MKKTDDFDWKSYTSDYYKKETQDAYKRGETFLIKDSTIEDGKIIFRDNIHEHIRHLLEHINEVKPISVIECGCGGGHNLYNIFKLFPEINIHGFDLLESQIVEMGEYLGISDFTHGRTTPADMTSDDFSIGAAAEYVFTNAVMMHLSYPNAVKFAKNLGELSWRWIRITEDLGQHLYPRAFEEAGVLKNFNIVSAENCVMILKRK